MTHRTDLEIHEANRRIAHAFSYGQEQGIVWLRNAFHQHEEAVAELRARKRELEGLFLAAVTRPLTVEEARACRVCRVCRRSSEASKELGAFVLNFGEEFAHEGCLPLC